MIEAHRTLKDTVKKLKWVIFKSMAKHVQIRHLEDLAKTIADIELEKWAFPELNDAKQLHDKVNLEIVNEEAKDSKTLRRAIEMYDDNGWEESPELQKAKQKKEELEQQEKEQLEIAMQTRDTEKLRKAIEVYKSNGWKNRPELKEAEELLLTKLKPMEGKITILIQ